ncbi:MAG: hypothetical protein ABL889_18195 [Terricaulis sp.]
MVPVVFTASDEGSAVCPIVLAVKHLDRVAIAASAVALDIKRVPHHRPRAACRLRVDLGVYLHRHPLAAGGPLVFQFDGACAAAPTVPGRACARGNTLGAGGGRRMKYRPRGRVGFRATPADVAFEFVFVVHHVRLFVSAQRSFLALPHFAASRAATRWKKRCADKPLCIQHCGAFYLALLIGQVFAFFFLIPRSPLLFATLHQRRALVKIV